MLEKIVRRLEKASENLKRREMPVGDVMPATTENVPSVSDSIPAVKISTSNHEVTSPRPDPDVTTPAAMTDVTTPSAIPDVTTPAETTEPPRLIIDPAYREKVLLAHTAERAKLNATNMPHLVRIFILS